MSTNDRDLVARLLDAGRLDAAPDETARQARIYEGIAGGGPSGGSGSRQPRSWVGVTAIGLGAIALIGAGSFALSSSWSIRSDAPPVIEAIHSAAAPIMIAEAPPSAGGTSVWELPSASAPKKVAVAPSADADELALELAAIERARKKLREHDAAGAMVLLDDFDRRFPRPRIGDEASVLRVEVLIALGRTDEARRLGRDFVARHPDSIYRARIAQMLGDASP